MNLSEYKKQKQNEKFNSLPKNFKILITWCKWLEYDFKNNIESDDYYTYSNIRYWCMKELDEWYDMSLEDVPAIKNETEFIKTWFNLSKILPKNELIHINPKKEYNIIKHYNGLKLIEQSK